MSNICFECINAVPTAEHGCPWSERFEPVPGWTATPDIIRCHPAKDIETYNITACPLFERG